jgi:hypothetical protein
MRGAAAPAGGCAVLSENLGEPLAGTAPVADAWLCLEQPGPWGRNALSESHLDRDIGDELLRRSEGTGVRILLIRRPGSHADLHVPRPRRVYVAFTRPGATWLEQSTVSDPKELLDVDFPAVGAGAPVGLGRRRAPLLLVCTNGRRDLCCALLARPVAGALAERHQDAVWECTHLGGHRFAPTALTLPTGYAYGRLDASSAESVLVAAGAGQVVPGLCRGRSTWARAGQAAELAVRERIGDVDADALTVEPAGAAVRVRHVDGRAWRVSVAERPLSPARPESCGKAATTPTALVVTDLVALA